MVFIFLLCGTSRTISVCGDEKDLLPRKDVGCTKTPLRAEQNKIPEEALVAKIFFAKGLVGRCIYSVHSRCRFNADVGRMFRREARLLCRCKDSRESSGCKFFWALPINRSLDSLFSVSR